MSLVPFVASFVLVACLLFFPSLTIEIRIGKHEIVTCTAWIARQLPELGSLPFSAIGSRYADRHKDGTG